ncbi:CHD5-like protein-domain-containing protein [Tuber brumale]|nr:CHD5-like protein-domain-containing protein [Tuber brumale]
MISLLMLIIALAITTHLINALGATAIKNGLWMIFISLPTKTSQDVQNQKALQKEVVKLRAELRGTSSQDEFAKWAKTRRALDRKVADLENLTGSVNAARTKFDTQTGFVRWASTSGAGWAVSLWYRREPIFWIPEGWVPGYVEWGLSFPKAPIGSVSIQVWAFAVSQVLRVIAPIIGSLITSVMFMRKPVAPMPAGSGEKGKEEL